MRRFHSARLRRCNSVTTHQSVVRGRPLPAGGSTGPPILNWSRALRAALASYICINSFSYTPRTPTCQGKSTKTASPYACVDTKSHIVHESRYRQNGGDVIRGTGCGKRVSRGGGMSGPKRGQIILRGERQSSLWLHYTWGGSGPRPSFSNGSFAEEHGLLSGSTRGGNTFLQ